MHIAIVSPEFPPDIGGVETYALEYAKALAALGHNVTVYTKRHPQGELSIEGIKVKPVLKMRLHEDRRVLAFEQADAWHIMNAAYAWLVEDRPGLIASVHGNDFLHPYYPLAQPDWKRLPLGWRLETHQPSWFRSLWIKRTANLMRRYLPKVHHILTNSRYTEQALLKRYPGCVGRTSAAYVGVAKQFFEIERQSNLDGIPHLLTVCRLSEPRKNVESVLRALAKLHPEFSFRYTVIGDGHDRLRLEMLSHELGLGASVHFTGFVDQEELKAHYATADLFILASSVNSRSHEGFGIVYLEAAASGIPSLATRLAGAAEAVKEGVSGMFVETPASETIEYALRQFLSGEKRFEAQACRDFARNFTWRLVVENALPYY